MHGWSPFYPNNTRKMRNISPLPSVHPLPERLACLVLEYSNIFGVFPCWYTIQCQVTHFQL